MGPNKCWSELFYTKTYVKNLETEKAVWGSVPFRYFNMSRIY